MNGSEPTRLERQNHGGHGDRAANQRRHFVNSRKVRILSFNFVIWDRLTEEMAQRIARLSPRTSLLFLCDMQEKFRSSIKYFPQIVETSNKLLQVCKLLDVPYVVTEQYPKGTRQIDTIKADSRVTSLRRSAQVSVERSPSSTSATRRSSRKPCSPCARRIYSVT